VVIPEGLATVVGAAVCSAFFSAAGSIVSSMVFVARHGEQIKSLQQDVAEIKGLVGNGDDGHFVRRQECVLREQMMRDRLDAVLGSNDQ